MTNEERAKRNRENVKAWKARNPEKVAEQQRRYRLKHREKRLVYMRTYYREITEKARAYDELQKGGGEE